MVIVLEKKPFQFWREIWIWVIVILLQLNWVVSSYLIKTVLQEIQNFILICSMYYLKAFQYCFVHTMNWKLINPTWHNKGVLENLTISLNHWLVPKKPKPKDTFWQRRKKRFQRRFSWTHIKKNWQLFVFMGFIFTVNVVLFVTRAVYFRWVSLWITIEKEKREFYESILRRTFLWHK